MSRTLPPRPDFTQLKHQAKDLLRAHERKDPAACPVLRRLRRFGTKSASADDAAILAAPLALHEAQYALAMEYGFASWNAMKRYVEKVTGRPSPVRREGGRTYIAGLEKHPISVDGHHETSHIACLAGVMAALGEDFSYDYLMGVSGAAFRVQIHQPDWCPSAACVPCGYECLSGAVKATGYRLRAIDVKHNPSQQEGIAQATPALAASIDRGIPAIFASEEAGLIVGYDADGKRIMRPYYADTEGYRDTTDWPWVLMLVEPQDAPADTRQALCDSLHLAVTLAKAERFGEYASGFNALGLWIAQLEEESRFVGLTEQTWFRPAHANGYCFGVLWSARKSARNYLREAAASYDDPVRSHLLEISGIYDRMDGIFGRHRPEFACAWSLMPWRIGGPDKWTPQVRYAQAQVLREVLDLERQVVAKIEAVLPLMDGRQGGE